MSKLRKWLIMKLIGETPIIMNVTIVLDDQIKGAKPDGIFERCQIKYSKRLTGSKNKKTAVMK